VLADRSTHFRERTHSRADNHTARGANDTGRCDDGGMPRPPRPITHLALSLLAAAAVLSACGGQNPYEAAESSNTQATVASSTPGESVVGDNDFLPESNLSTCIGAVDRPNCGSKSKGGWRMYLTFAVLLSGMAFIGWRIARSIKARDAVVNAGTEDGAIPSRSTAGAPARPTTPDESTSDTPIE
jgi:hypothetical protein